MQAEMRVACRLRPLNAREEALGPGCLSYSDNRVTVGPKSFSFDPVFPPDTPQHVVHDCISRPLVSSLLQGFNVTVLAYGQTGSGKTYTLTGTEEQPGIIPRVSGTLFAAIREAERGLEFSLKVSYLDLYCERLRDLLKFSNESLCIREDKQRGLYVSGLTEAYIASAADLRTCVSQGSQNRSVAQTHMSECSSRAHSLLLLTVTHTSTVDLTAKTGKMWLVDLAGSERVSKCGRVGERLKEANLNTSLAVLGRIIYTLTDGKSTHIPYRDSKLTRLLQDSLGGNAYTTVILTCSPSTFNEEETLSTLRFGARAKLVLNRPRINEEMTSSVLKLRLARAEAEKRAKNAVIHELSTKLAQLGVDTSGLLEEKWGFEGIEEEVRKEMTYMRDTIRELKGENEALRSKLRTCGIDEQTESSIATAQDSSPTEESAAYWNAQLIAENAALKEQIGSLLSSVSQLSTQEGETPVWQVQKRVLAGTKQYELSEH